MQDFIHLHVHTQYSILDGQAAISKLVDKAISDGMRGMAVTDHGNMFGIKEFFDYTNKKNGGIKGEIKELKKKIKGIENGTTECENKEETIAAYTRQIEELNKKMFKPIIGCEMYVARRRLFNKEGRPDQSGYHLIVLAKNQKGYHNLIKLVSKAWTEGEYMRPRTDRAELEKYHEGLIVASACLAGEVPRRITADQYEEAEEAIRWYKSIFGDDYYLELQRHKATVARANHEAYPMQQKVNEKLIEYSRKFGVKLICTNDVHFVDESNAEAHDRLICLSTGKDLDDPNRMIYTKQEWMKTKEEMNNVFSDVPEALANTIEILDKVEFYDIEHAPILPNFPKPKGFDNDDDYLRYLTYEGAKKRWGDLNDEQKERIEFELTTIKNMGFPGYFLIVQDFISAARSMGVSVGPGRGSAAGSAVAYCLGITQIDPIEYDLLFERFLNPDRISLPDIDIDFDDDGRGEVLRWVTQKYGSEKVAHIITYGTMAAKMALKDVARVEKLPLAESDRLTKLIPDKIPDVKKVNLEAAIAHVPELQAAEASPDPKLSNTIKYAKMLEGNVRNTGVHACGTIICRDDITDWVPVSTAKDKDTGEKILVTQYEGSVIESTGLIKMDFLGLKTLSIIKEALENIKTSRGAVIDRDNISMQDPATYRLYSEGRTVGTFQFESAGMQKYLKELQPTTFEDLIAMNALYRPGPMEYIPQFINRKHGKEKIEYDIPVMEKYLKDTYGITVYQEQVMLLSRLLANFTRGESDGLRKAMGKKLKDKLDSLKPKFISGGQSNGHDPKVLEKIWADWEKFASYAFNKSHATCYSWVAYQTAYLKANYPAEYMAAVMSRNINDIKELTKLMTECHAMGIDVLEPDINESNMKFTATPNGNIRFGLGAIKGVGENAVMAIISEREKNGPYKNFFDLMQRANLSICNRKTFESIIMAGGLDCFQNIKREQYFAENSRGETFIETAIRYGNRYQADKEIMTNSLFGDEISEVEIAVPEIPQGETWSDLYKLNREKEFVGIYISAHPLDEYAHILDNVCNTAMSEINAQEDLSAKQEIIMGGMVTAVKEGYTKNGNPYGVATIEDFSGSAEFPLFGEEWVKWKNFMSIGMFLLIRAKMTANRWRPERKDLRISSIELLPDIKDKVITRLTVNVPLGSITPILINDLTETIRSHPGNADLHFNIYDDIQNEIKVDMRSRKFKISVSKDLLDTLKEDMELSYHVN